MALTVASEGSEPPKPRAQHPESLDLSPPAIQDELASLYEMSVELAGLHELPQVLDTALGFCLQLTSSTFGFVGLLNVTAVMDVAAIKGFSPADPSFYDRFRAIPVHPNVFGVVILEGRPHLSNDVPNDPLSRGHPHGHPPVRTFLGVPLLLRGEIIGMLGVANRPGGYAAADERLLVTFAVTWLEREAPERARVQARGKIPGSAVDMMTEMTLTEAGDAQALPHREADVSVKGVIASVGGRLIQVAADKITQQLFACIKAKLEAPAPASAAPPG